LGNERKPREIKINQMSVVLRKRKNPNGTISIRLDIHHNGQRVWETLSNLKLSKVANATDRAHNKEMMQQAEAIRLARAVELEGNNYSIESQAGKRTIVVTWLQTYIDAYTKKDKRTMQSARNHFVKYLSKTKNANLTFDNLTALIIEDFIDYLESISTGEGASSYYSRFKKMIKHAFRKRLMKENVLDYVERKVSGKAKKKDTLTIPELKILNATPTESSEVKRAFLFSCVSGLRWGDIKVLKWSSVNISNKQMDITQGKTGESVTTPLNDTALNLLGPAGKQEVNVFVLPSANGANKTLKAWVKRAKIEKAITWHNARHSFGTNLIFNDVDVLTASKLLGHTSMKHTQRYVKASEEMKQRATDKLNFEL